MVLTFTLIRMVKKWKKKTVDEVAHPSGIELWWCYNKRELKEKPMNIPNYIHNSGKAKKGKGIAKGRIKARKQALKALKAKYE